MPGTDKTIASQPARQKPTGDIAAQQPSEKSRKGVPLTSIQSPQSPSNSKRVTQGKGG